MRCLTFCSLAENSKIGGLQLILKRSSCLGPDGLLGFFKELLQFFDFGEQRLDIAEGYSRSQQQVLVKILAYFCDHSFVVEAYPVLEISADPWVSQIPRGDYSHPIICKVDLGVKAGQVR